MAVKDMVRYSGLLNAFTEGQQNMQRRQLQRDNELIDAAGRPDYLPASENELIDAAGGARTEMDPVLVDATRLQRPAVEGVTLRRVAPGSGTQGAGVDLVAQEVSRQRPMSYDAGRASGLIVAPRANGGVPDVQLLDRKAIGMVDAMRQGRDRSMTMAGEGDRRRVMDETRPERWGWAGTNKAAQSVLANLRGVQQQDRMGKVAVRQAGEMEEVQTRGVRSRPQAVAGNAGQSTWDPVKQEWTSTMVERPVQAAARVPMTWDEYTPAELGDMVNETVRSMMPEGDSKAFQTALLTAGEDEKKRQAVYRQFSARPTPAQELLLNTALSQLQKRRGSVAGGAAGASGGAGKSWKDVVAKK